MKLTAEQEKALFALKVRPFAEDLRRLPLARLKEEFGAKASGRVLLVPLCRNVVYQAATWMLEGKVNKVFGNLRSLYYQWLKPVLSRLADVLKPKSDPYEQMLNTLELFVGELRLFRYRDLELVDERWENRWFTDGRNPHLLLFAEKNGFGPFLQEQSRAFGLTALALGGSPSHLSSEYFAAQLKKRARGEESFVVFGVMDYDPAGADISRSFRAQLAHEGLVLKTAYELCTPAAFSAEELALFRFPLPKKPLAQVERWLKATGGLGGEAFGLEADSLPKDRLRDLLAQKLRPLLRR